MLSSFIHAYLKIFFVLTPFFVTSTFVAMTSDYGEEKRKKTAIKITIAVLISSFIIYMFGQYIFALFGITLDAFRIGAGALLFLSALQLVEGSPTSRQKQPKTADEDQDIAVVPLAIPITVGPGVIGMLMVMAAELPSTSDRLLVSGALLCAVATVGGLLYVSGGIERLIGNKGLTILTKLTGLFVSAIAAQLIFTGLRNFLILPLN
ncbi:MAG TPA: MarC family protein [Desulfomicrobiaceae bacterium]|nr:MarC family protein [Desulfomicrobiaceae bacterium]